MEPHTSGLKFRLVLKVLDTQFEISDLSSKYIFSFKLFLEVNEAFRRIFARKSGKGIYELEL